ncbi:MAG: hypothetical protein V4501_12835 [Pseudomonadota bacterium]
MKNRRNDEEISKLFNDPDKLTIIIQSGIEDALLKHKQAGNPICEWKDNKVVWISAKNIPTSKPNKNK